MNSFCTTIPFRGRDILAFVSYDTEPNMFSALPDAVTITHVCTKQGTELLETLDDETKACVLQEACDHWDRLKEKNAEKYSRRESEVE